MTREQLVEKCKRLVDDYARKFASATTRVDAFDAEIAAYAAIDELSASLPSTVLVGLPHVGDDGFGCATLEWQRGDRRIKMHPNGVGLLKIGGQNIDEISLADRQAAADAFEWLAASPESVEPDASPEAPAPQGVQAETLKPLVSELMGRARLFRSAGAGDYDAAYKALEQRLYTVLGATPPSPPAVQPNNDTALLDYLRDECLDLRCKNVPTGGDDYVVRWHVIGHYGDAPHERVAGESFSEEPRDAIRAAMSVGQSHQPEAPPAVQPAREGSLLSRIANLEQENESLRMQVLRLERAARPATPHELKEQRIGVIAAECGVSDETVRSILANMPRASVGMVGGHVPAVSPDVQELVAVLARMESAFDWFVGRSAFTQSTQLKGAAFGAGVRKEAYAAHDAVRAALSKYGSKQ